MRSCRLCLQRGLQALDQVQMPTPDLTTWKNAGTTVRKYDTTPSVETSETFQI
jgi:hypothetical protein